NGAEIGVPNAAFDQNGVAVSNAAHQLIDEAGRIPEQPAVNFPWQTFLERPHLLPVQEHLVKVRRQERLKERGVQDGGLIAQNDDAAEDRNPAMLRIRRVERRYLEGRFHRKDFGIVTVVEKSDLSAAGKGEQPAFQTTCAPIVGD